MAELTELQSAMRLGLRRLAKAVVVIACRWEGQRHAMTATAVSELSFDPPSLLICVNQSASLYVPLSQGADFSVNILHSSHEFVAALCTGATKGEARFAQGRWSHSDAAIPSLEDAQAAFLCKNDARLQYGTHWIFIGRVIKAFSSGTVDPLVYVDGKYKTIGLRTGVDEPSASRE